MAMNDLPASPSLLYVAVIREAGRSRIYGGIHFQFSNAGREAGHAIGLEIARTKLRGDSRSQSPCQP